MPYTLGHSRVRFYTILEWLLNRTDPNKFEYCYSDTDSMYCHVKGGCIEDAVAEEERERFEKEKDSIFENKGSLHTPASLLKLEGKWKSAVFRGT